MADDRVALITGAANGIGRATALAFAEAGYRIVGWDLADGDVLLDELGELEVDASFARVDVSDPDGVAAGVAELVDEYGRIDVLINNAGILDDAQLVKVRDGVVVDGLSIAAFDRVIAVNLRGVFVCTQAVVPHMIARRYGRIVNASSVVGVYGNFGQTNYVAAKSGVIGMTKVWARELGKHGITVNAVAPGFVGTDMVRQMPARVLESMVARTPVGRMGEVGDIARAYVFLADERSGFISGAVLGVDGGMVVGT